MRGNPCWLRWRPPGNLLRCGPSCIARSGSRVSWGDRPERGSTRRARNQKMHRSSRAPAGRQVEPGRPPRIDPLSANVRRWLALGGEMTRRCGFRWDRRLRQGTNKAACSDAHLPACPGCPESTPSSISDPPRSNRTQVSKTKHPSPPSEGNTIESQGADRNTDLECGTVRMYAKFFSHHKHRSISWGTGVLL